ncbi:hypothetical protein T08_14603 [Trichinella sp. T8]|nr:hypothetical protein T08_14603 [Trichinella sp. T8]
MLTFTKGVFFVSYYLLFIPSNAYEARVQQEIVTEKSGNNVIYSQATYDKIVYDLLRIQAKGTSSAEDHNLNRQFGLFIVVEGHKLIRKRKNGAIRQIQKHLKRCFPSLGIPIRVLVTVEKDVFGDKKEMGHVTLEICKICIRYCEDCQLK